MTASGNVLLIIAGMHRSGTSAITGAIEGLGVVLGRDLAGPHAGINDLGYKEDVDVIELHEDLLWSLGSAWDDIFPTEINKLDNSIRVLALERNKEILNQYFRSSRCCAVKDPRICLFLPLWLESCKELEIDVRFLIPFRSPLAVARSLAKRDGILPDRAMILWAKHILAAEKYSRGHSRIFLSYDRLLAAPGEVLASIVDRLALQLPGDRAEAIERGARFVAGSLNRNAAEDRPGEPRLRFPLELYDLCRSVDGADLDQQAQARFDEIREDYLAFLHSADPVLIDQVQAFRNHAIEFRCYWRDAANSRANRLGSLLRTLLRSVGLGD